MMFLQTNVSALRHLAIALSVAVCLHGFSCASVQANSDKAPLIETQETENQPKQGKASTSDVASVDATTESLSAEAQAELKSLPKKTQDELKERSEAILFEAKAVNNELRDDEELSVNDIAMLWQAAVERSGTIRFAIEKLSRRDATGESVNEGSLIKKMAHNAVSIAGLASGAVTGSPAGLIGGNMLENLLLDNPTNSAFNRVTDADMIILAKEVENLQQRVIENYYQYIHCEKRYKLTEEALSAMNRHIDHANANAPTAESKSDKTESAVSDTSVANEAIMSALVQSANKTKTKPDRPI